MERKGVHIKLSDLSIGYSHGKTQKVVKESLNLSAIPGELVALIGSNGIGKSTPVAFFMWFPGNTKRANIV